MHADHPKSDDLTALESRLAAWQPAAQNLDADRMLYAAGRASAERGSGRLVWPALSGVLAILIAVLGVQLSRERAEREALMARLSPKAPLSPQYQAAVTEPDRVARAEPLAPASLFAARRALEAGVETWKAAEPPTSPEPESPTSAILQVWQSQRVLEN